MREEKSTKNIIKERLVTALALSTARNEYVGIADVVQAHDKCFLPTIDEIVKKANFKNRAELFQFFSKEFIVSENELSIASTRSTPTPSIQYQQIRGFSSDCRVKAWKTDVFVRHISNNAFIQQPTQASTFSELAIPARILANLRKMDIQKLTKIQQYILPYIFNISKDILIEGVEKTGKSIGVIISILSQVHMYKSTIRKHKRGPIAIFLLQCSPYRESDADEGAKKYCDYFFKYLRLICNNMDISIHFDGLKTTKDIALITFDELDSKADLSDLKFFVACHVDKIVMKVGMERFAARICPFVPSYAASIYFMQEYCDPGPISIRDCLKKDALFISDKS